MSTRVNITVEADDGTEELTLEVSHPMDRLPADVVQSLIQKAANAAQAYLDTPESVFGSD